MLFWKTPARPALLKAFDKGTNLDLCRAILCSVMDEQNIVKIDGVLSVAIADLTGRPLRRIQEALQDLQDQNFGSMTNKGTFQVHKDEATKARMGMQIKQKLPKNQASDAALEFYARMHTVFRMPEFKKKDDEMIAKLQKQVDVLAEQNKTILEKHEESLLKHAETLALLRELIAGQNPSETKERAARHLSVVGKTE